LGVRFTEAIGIRKGPIGESGVAPLDIIHEDNRIIMIKSKNKNARNKLGQAEEQGEHRKIEL
jgi:hypothetical protein